MPLPRFVGVTGFKESGKDTFARVLVERAGYVRVAFADTLKRDIAAWLGIAVEGIEERKAEFRATMQCYGDKMRRADERYLIRKLGVETLAALPKDARIVVTDVRKLNEADWVWRQDGIIVRQVRAGEYKTDDQHSTEIEVNQIPPDYTVDVNSVRARELGAEMLLREWGWEG